MPDAPLSDEEVDALLRPLARYPAIVLAVSGGTDSTALMFAAAGWCRRLANPPQLIVVTVDHALRAEAATEAVAVAGQAAALGLEHRTRRWLGPKPATGLQAAAREARYGLLVDVARQRGAVAIVTAHTADDQAETLLMRLARGSGVDGLSGIPAVGHVELRDATGERLAFPVHRPFLGTSRARLTASLAAAGVSCIDDPSNRDTRFERVRMREALILLQGLGLTRDAIVRSAQRLQSAKDALTQATDALWVAAVEQPFGIVLEINRDRVAGAPDAIGLRLLRRALAQAGGAAKPAELAAVESAYRRLFRADAAAQPAFTLGGALIEAVQPDRPHTAVIRLDREPHRDGGLPTITVAAGDGAAWDARFWVEVGLGHAEPVQVGPLGDDASGLVRVHNCLSALPIAAGAMRGVPVFRQRGLIVAAPLLAVFARLHGDLAAAAALLGPVEPAPESRMAQPVLRARPLDKAPRRSADRWET